MTNFTPPHQLVDIPLTSGVLLALSGGADSCALLHLLAADAAKKGYPLHTAHVHHGIRGEEADRDEQFCRALAARYALPYHVLHADVPALAQERGESLEMTGRRVRYDYFATLMQQLHLPLLATAHHADDNLETVLLRLVTGSATAGLGGIAPSRPFGCGTLIRPLLHTTRAEIEAYCEKNGLSFVCDSTNGDTAYLRNRLRAELLPVLNSIAPHIRTQVLHTCEILREDDAYLETLADALYTRAVTLDGALLLSELQAAPPPLQKRAMLMALRRLSPDARMQHCHMEALCHLLTVQHGETCLPCDIRAIADGQLLRFVSHPRKMPPPPSFHAPLQMGTHTFTSLGIRVTLSEITDPLASETAANSKNAKNPQNVYNTFIYDTLTFDTITVDAYFRLRQTGDTLFLGGMHRKLRKLQNAAHMPPDLRDRLPLLCDAQGVLWAPFIGVRDGFNTSPHGKYRLQLTVHEAPTATASPIENRKNTNNNNFEVSP